MDKEYRFYLNDIELIHDVYNFNNIDFTIQRNSDYWGYYRGASLDTLDFIKEDADLVRSIWENGNINTEVSFRIETLNNRYSKYEVLQDGVLNFNEYSEKIDANGVLIVSVGFYNNLTQEKIKSRGQNELVIGDNLSVEGEPLTGNDLIDVTYKRSKQRFFSSWRWSTYLQNVTAGAITESIIPTFDNPDQNSTGTPYSPLVLELQPNSNDLSANSQTHQGDRLGNTESSFMFTKSPITRTVTFKANIDLDMAVVLDLSLIDSSSSLIEVGIAEYEYNTLTNEFDRVGFVTGVASAVVPLTTGFAPITALDPYDGELDGVWASSYRYKYFSLNINIDQTFTKKAQHAYRLEFSAKSSNLSGSTESAYFYGQVVDGNDNSVIAYYDDNLDEYPDTTHKASLVYESLDSLVSQITDKENVLKSNFFGRTENGYSEDGAGSLMAITSGFLLRNAFNSDGTEIDLTMSFYNLYKTLDAIYGLAMWRDGDNICIEKRSDSFGNIETKLRYNELTSEVMSELIYTSVEVGNNRIPYEDVNGTNEHNTILEFSTPLRADENKLELITIYNTDYTGIERARRLSFVNSDSVDTKYDEKIFLSIVERDGGGFKTILGYTGFSYISGIILPAEAGNLALSPKRMLINNADLISSSFWKVDKDLIYKSSENLSTLESTETGGTLVIEQADLTKSEMGEVIFKPFKHTLTVGKRDIVEALNNPLNYYTFIVNEETKICELWSATINNNKGTIELIER